MSALSIENQVNARTAVINDHSEAFLGAKTNVSEKEAAALTFYDNGMIRTCNPEAVDLLNCLTSELTGQHITKLIPQLKEVELIQDNKLNPYLHFLSHIGHPFKVATMSGSYFMSELFFIDMEHLGKHYVRVIIRPVK